MTFTFQKEESVEIAKSLIENAEVDQKELRITVENGAEHIPIFMNTFAESNLNVKSVSANKPTLDDVFLKVTGSRLENETPTEKKQNKRPSRGRPGRRGAR